jgi:hypothetical protein
MAKYLNQDLGFDEVRWRTMRKTSYDSALSFDGPAEKVLLQIGAKLFRLVHLPNGQYFDGLWWMPESTFEELHDNANSASHGGGRLLRNYVAEALALPSGGSQLCVVEIELVQPVFAWSGPASALFGRPGRMDQIYLPNLGMSGDPRYSHHAKVTRTYWLKF